LRDGFAAGNGVSESQLKSGGETELERIGAIR
jgi:hypothetical protein